MNEIRKEHIEEFLDEFMLIEYKGKDHIVARAHFRETFNEIIPKFFERKEEVGPTNVTELIGDNDSKNIVIIGAGYGVLTVPLCAWKDY